MTPARSKRLCGGGLAGQAGWSDARALEEALKLGLREGIAVRLVDDRFAGRGGEPLDDLPSAARLGHDFVGMLHPHHGDARRPRPADAVGDVGDRLLAQGGPGHDVVLRIDDEQGRCITSRHGDPFERMFDRSVRPSRRRVNLRIDRATAWARSNGDGGRIAAHRPAGAGAYASVGPWRRLEAYAYREPPFR